MPRPARPHWSKSRHRWYANIGEPDANGRRREVFAPEILGPRDERKARDWMLDEVSRREKDEAPVKASDDLTVGGLAQLYLAWAEGRIGDGKLSPRHYDNKVHHLRRFAAAYGNRQARTIATEDMEAFVTSLQREGLAPTYVHNLCATVAAAFNWAVTPGKHLPASPIKGFERPTVPRGPERFAEREEAAVWLRHFWRRTRPDLVNARFDRLTVLMQRAMIRSGARPGELVALLWDDIRWNGWTSSAGHTCARAIIPADRWKAGRTTGKPRVIYFTSGVTRALRREFRRPDRHPLAVFVKGRGKGGKGAGEPWPDSSILSKKIRVVRRELIARQEEIRQRIEIGADVTDRERRIAAVAIQDDGADRLSNYRWRHTAISTLLMQGVDTPTVAELCGTSPEMIYKTYGHLLDKHLQGAAERLAGGRKTRGGGL